MNSILFYFIFIVLAFVILTIAMRIAPKDSIFTIAIGAVIGANIYNSTNYPIQILGLTFGIDSIVYTIFAFCLLLMYIDYGKSSLKIVLYTSMFSIFFTAFLFFMGNFSQTGLEYSTSVVTLSYIASIIGTFLAVWGMIWVYDALREKSVNQYVCIVISLFVCSVINSLVYFGLSFLLGVSILSFWEQLAGSYIGKFIASLCCLLVFFAHRMWGRCNNKKVED